MVDIFVGTERKKFRLHRDLLCDRSDYFKACFLGKFKEAQQKELSLPEDNVEGFGLLVRWLYGAPLKKMSSNDDLPVYCALIILANKLLLEHLHNEAMDSMLRFHRTNPVSIDVESLHNIYQNTSDQERVRKYFVSLAAWTTASKKNFFLGADYKRLIREVGDFAVDYTVRLSIYYAGLTRSGDIGKVDPRKVSNCTNHKHNSTPICGETSERGAFSRLKC